MNFTKATSILTIFLIFVANYLTFCPACESRISEVHFMTETCDSHDCHRNEESCSGSDNKKSCQHEICLDRPLTSEFLRKTPITIDFFISPSSPITRDLFSTGRESSFQPTALMFPPSFVHRSRVLRI